MTRENTGEELAQLMPVLDDELSTIYFRKVRIHSVANAVGWPDNVTSARLKQLEEIGVIERGVKGGSWLRLNWPGWPSTKAPLRASTSIEDRILAGLEAYRGKGWVTLEALTKYASTWGASGPQIARVLRDMAHEGLIDGLEQSDKAPFRVLLGAEPEAPKPEPVVELDPEFTPKPEKSAWAMFPNDPSKMGMDQLVSAGKELGALLEKYRAEYKRRTKGPF